MTEMIYTFTIENEDGETSAHEFFDYTAGWEFTRRAQYDYHNACGGWLDVTVDWKETEINRDYVIKSNGEIIWED